jgi:hypothetical protein
MYIAMTAADPVLFPSGTKANAAGGWKLAAYQIVRRESKRTVALAGDFCGRRPSTAAVFYVYSIKNGQQQQQLKTLAVAELAEQPVHTGRPTEQTPEPAAKTKKSDLSAAGVDARKVIAAMTAAIAASPSKELHVGDIMAAMSISDPVTFPDLHTYTLPGSWKSVVKNQLRNASSKRSGGGKSMRSDFTLTRAAMTSFDSSRAQTHYYYGIKDTATTSKAGGARAGPADQAQAGSKRLRANCDSTDSPLSVRHKPLLSAGQRVDPDPCMPPQQQLPTAEPQSPEAGSTPAWFWRPLSSGVDLSVDTDSEADE